MSRHDSTKRVQVYNEKIIRLKEDKEKEKGTKEKKN
jgi:hypothetical protein